MAAWIEGWRAAGGFERPWALGLLAVPLLALLLRRRMGRPPRRRLGTLALLGEASELASSARRRPRWPAWMLLLAAGMACCAIGLAGPRVLRPGAGGRAELHVVLDRGWRLDAGGRFSPPTAPDRTRLAEALERARPWLRRCEELGLRVEWTASGGLPADLAEDRGPRLAALLEACSVSEPGAPQTSVAPRLTLLPRPPPSAFEGAYVSAGGAACDGAVARGPGDEVLVLEAGALVERPLELSGHLRLGPDVPAPLASLTRAWAAARGLSGDPLDGPPLLELTSFEAGTGQRAAREGFAVRIRPRAESERSPDAAVGPEAELRELGPSPREQWPSPREQGTALRGEPWLQGAAGEALVVAGPGRVVAAAGTWSIEGDPLAFPAAWVRLLDGVVLEPPELVPAGARGALQGRQRLDLEQLEAARAADAPRTLLPELGALGALLFALAALALWRA